MPHQTSRQNDESVFSKRNFCPSFHHSFCSAFSVLQYLKGKIKNIFKYHQKRITIRMCGTAERGTSLLIGTPGWTTTRELFIVSCRPRPCVQRCKPSLRATLPPPAATVLPSQPPKLWAQDHLQFSSRS